MRDLNKYKGVIPAFYACYDEKGEISPGGVQALTRYFADKGVRGVYVNGSSGEFTRVWKIGSSFWKM